MYPSNNNFKKASFTLQEPSYDPIRPQTPKTHKRNPSDFQMLDLENNPNENKDNKPIEIAEVDQHKEEADVNTELDIQPLEVNCDNDNKTTADNTQTYKVNNRYNSMADTNNDSLIDQIKPTETSYNEKVKGNDNENTDFLKTLERLKNGTNKKLMKQSEESFSNRIDRIEITDAKNSLMKEEKANYNNLNYLSISQISKGDTSFVDEKNSTVGINPEKSLYHNFQGGTNPSSDYNIEHFSKNVITPNNVLSSDGHFRRRNFEMKQKLQRFKEEKLLNEISEIKQPKMNKKSEQIIKQVRNKQKMNSFANVSSISNISNITNTKNISEINPNSSQFNISNFNSSQVNSSEIQSKQQEESRIHRSIVKTTKEGHFDRRKLHSAEVLTPRSEQEKRKQFYVGILNNNKLLKKPKQNQPHNESYSCGKRSKSQISLSTSRHKALHLKVDLSFIDNKSLLLENSHLSQLREVDSPVKTENKASLNTSNKKPKQNKPSKSNIYPHKKEVSYVSNYTKRMDNRKLKQEENDLVKEQKKIKIEIPINYANFKIYGHGTERINDNLNEVQVNYTERKGKEAKSHIKKFNEIHYVNGTNIKPDSPPKSCKRARFSMDKSIIEVKKEEELIDSNIPNILNTVNTVNAVNTPNTNNNSTSTNPLPINVSDLTNNPTVYVAEIDLFSDDVNKEVDLIEDKEQTKAYEEKKLMRGLSMNDNSPIKNETIYPDSKTSSPLNLINETNETSTIEKNKTPSPNFKHSKTTTINPQNPQQKPKTKGIEKLLLMGKR